MNAAKDQQKNENPRERANPFSVLFFIYTFGLFKKGYRKDLDVEDLYEPLSADRSDVLGGRLERKWNQLLTVSKKQKLVRALVRTFWPEYLYLIGLLAILDLFCQILNTYLLGKLLEYFKTGNDMQYNEAMIYASAMVVTNILIAILVNQYMLCAYHYGMKVRAACCALIYRKALKLTNTSLRETTSGQLVNLLSNDVSRFDIISYFVAYMFIAPLTATVIGYLLWKEGGCWALIGMVPIFAVLPIHGMIGKLSTIYRRRVAFRTDERIRLMDEILAGIQVIKMYTWEIPFAKIIERARKQELNILTKLSFNRGVYMALGLFINRTALFCTLVALFATGKEISAQTVFVFMCYFNILSQSISSFFARGISEIAELIVIINRIEVFLLKEEYVDIKKNNDRNKEYVISLENATAKWDNDIVLYDLNLRVRNGTLVGVVGTVGSGKSSLLQMILGELKLHSGDITVQGSISYVPQEPFIFVGTIRQNILFGETYNEEKYKKVIQACALNVDFAQFIGGDLCYIGDRGISLSGGQKARVNLARALYRDSDVFLFDDPLSAVDVQVGNHIFEECFNKYLSGKTRILVTHHVNYLRHADNIIVMSNGRILAEGRYEALNEQNTLFTNLLHKSHDPIQPQQVEDITPDRDLNNKKVHVTDEKHSEFTEKSSKGAIKGSLLLKYISSCGNICFPLIVFLLFVLVQVLASGIDYYVSIWINYEDQKLARYNSTVHSNDLISSSNSYMYVYLGLIISLFVLALTRSLLFYKLAMTCSKKLHGRMYDAVVNTRMRFFHLNPSGRVLNRFSKDINSVDESLPKALLDAGQIILISVGSLVLVVFVDPHFVILVGMILTAFAIIRNIFLKSSKNIKRIEGILRSPVFTHLHATLQGLSIIRAYNVQDVVTNDFDRYQNEHTSAWYMYITASSAFGFYLDLICCVFTAFITFAFMTLNHSSSIGIVGLAVTQAIALTGIVQWGIRQSAEVANQLMSAERIFEYISLPAEVQPKEPLIPPENWPTKGEITLENVYLAYSPTGKSILKNLTLKINSKEKIGIVGRTGAGKSSIIQTLFRLAFVEGHIAIDGVDTSEIELGRLRRKLSIIPQDPVLFSGTLRYNLDPFEEYSDEVLFKALEEVELKHSLHLVNNLDSAVQDKGSNFSVGQRQLICLARALIRNNRILILDEATANVDPQTDELIQKTIRSKFADCTVLTIAHRLNTILDSDKILVMDGGAVVEFEDTQILLNNPQSTFYRMVTASE